MIHRLLRYIDMAVMRFVGMINQVSLALYQVRYGLNTERREEQIIVSLACYNARYRFLPTALKSILWQTYKPDRIIVWLDKDIPENRPTPEMRELEKFGVEYRFTDDDIKPHKKYLYSMREFPDAAIITFDDDVIYGKRIIEKLVRKHREYPNVVCAGRSHRIAWDENKNLKPYQDWVWEYKAESKPQLDLFATGVGGILYPPRLLPVETLSVETLRELCLENDDIWLKFMELLVEVPVANVRYCYPSGIKDSQKLSLNTSNVYGGNNDILINNMIEQYPRAYDILRKSVFDH